MPLSRSAVPFAILMLSLTGCGGGGGSSGASAPATATLEGVVADGYLGGAKACLDRNDNLRCDSGEPLAVTDALGRYRMEALAADASAHAIVVEVPPGTTDSDTPGQPVVDGYVLTAPVGKHAFISPLTTLVAGRQKNYPGLREDVATQITANLLQTSPESLYRNFLADASDESRRLHGIARMTARQMAYYTRIMAKRPEHVPEDARFLTALYDRMLSGDLPWLMIKPDPAPPPIAETPEQEAESVAALSGVLRSLKRGGTVVADILEPLRDGYFISNFHPADCTALGYPAPCAPDYPADTLQLTHITVTLSGNTVLPATSHTLWDRATAIQSTKAVPVPRALRLVNGVWESNFPRPAPLTDYARDKAVRLDLAGLNIREFLQNHRAPLHNFSLSWLENPQLPFRDSALFPAGAVAYRYLGLAEHTDYLIPDINPFNTETDLPIPRNRDLPDQPAFGSLAAFRDYYSPGGGNHALPLVGFTEESSEEPGVMYVTQEVSGQFLTNGSFELTRIQRDRAGNITRQTALTGGSWLVRSESGQEILTLQLPESITMGMFGESAWTVYQGQVVNVNVIPQDYARESLYLNLAAVQALIQALQAPAAAR
jgi:hypothetical protein